MTINRHKLNSMATKTASLSVIVNRLKELHTLNSAIEHYDHHKELKTRQLVIKALENISEELASIKKQLHTIKHRGTRG